jgi:hypothetical protein
MFSYAQFYLLGAFIVTCCAFDLDNTAPKIVYLSSGQSSLLGTACEPSDVAIELISNCGWGWGNYSMHIFNPGGDVNVYLTNEGHASSFCLHAEVAGAYVLHVKQINDIEDISPEDEKEVS